MQNLLNLMYREEEREMLPLCREEKVALIPWSPLAKGRLARPWGESTPRSENDETGQRFFPTASDADQRVADRVQELAGRRGVKMAQIALAWVLQQEPVAAPIVGSTKPEHLGDTVAALEITLTHEEMAFLEEPYVPHTVAGFA